MYDNHAWNKVIIKLSFIHNVTDKIMIFHPNREFYYAMNKSLIILLYNGTPISHGS